MGELEDRINSVLADPKQMEMISRLAESFMSGQGEKNTDAPHGSDSLGMDIDPALLARLGRLMADGGGEKKRERALLEAMMPYLSEKRRRKMGAAIKIARIAGIAGAALAEMGANGGDKPLSGKQR